MISVSLDGLFAPVLKGGLRRAELGAIEPQIRAAHDELMTRRGKDLGFYDLPTNAELIADIQAEAKRLRALADDLLVLGIGGSGAPPPVTCEMVTPGRSSIFARAWTPSSMTGWMIA